MKRWSWLLVLTLGIHLTAWSGFVHGQEVDAGELARKMQNPLSELRALATQTVFGFNTGDDKGTSINFQLLPIYAIPLRKIETIIIPRAVVPFVGVEPGSRGRYLGVDGEPVPPGAARYSGVGDVTAQLFIAPPVRGRFKWGIGPQVSMPTRSRPELAGPGWGAGATFIMVGSVTDDLSLVWFVNNHWGFDGKFSVLTIQPSVIYNFKAVPGLYVAYNGEITADWKAEPKNRWTVPLGLMIGKTFSLGQGWALDAQLGPYYQYPRPEGAADWTVRFVLGVGKP